MKKKKSSLFKEQNMDKEIKPLNETVDVNGSKVYVEDGQVKVSLNEEIQRTGYMSVEEAYELTIAEIKKIYQGGQ